MNANELADKLEKDGEGCTCAAYCAGECACDANWAEYHTKEAATMLRQQQAEIEALKADKVLHDEAYLSQMKEIEILKEAVELGLYALDNHNGNYKLTKKECDEMGVITEKMMEVLK